MPQARPPPRLGRLDQPGPQRVAFHIPHHGQEMLVRFDRERLEAALVERAGAGRPMRGVPALRLGHRQSPQELRQFAIPTGPEHEVPMVRQDAPRQQSHRHAGFRFLDHLFERFEVPFFAEDAHPPHGSIEHMVDVSPAGNSQASWHALRLPIVSGSVENKDTRPLKSSPLAPVRAQCLSRALTEKTKTRRVESGLYPPLYCLDFSPPTHLFPRFFLQSIVFAQRHTFAPIHRHRPVGHDALWLGLADHFNDPISDGYTQPHRT